MRAMESAHMCDIDRSWGFEFWFYRFAGIANCLVLFHYIFLSFYFILCLSMCVRACVCVYIDIYSYNLCFEFALKLDLTCPWFGCASMLSLLTPHIFFTS